jgi:hypothetical protein
MPPPWHFTTWLDLLDHWQSLVGGLLAFLAAVIVVGGSEFFARQKEQRETDAIRASLAVEIRQTINVLIDTHKVFKRALDKGTQVTAGDLNRGARLPKPTVYEASADKIGLLGALAPGVASFFIAIDRIGVSVDVITNLPLGEVVDKTALGSLVALFEQACQRSLPLLDALPRVEADAENIRARIEGMGKSA